jgi:hypothetical protein
MEWPEEDQESNQTPVGGVVMIGCLRSVSIILLAASVGCAAPSSQMKRSLVRHVANGDYPAAEQIIKQGKLSDYGKRNAVLYYLDLGLVLHDAGVYRHSDEQLARAEARMEALFTKSVTKATGTFLVSDDTQDYAGEAYERALLYVFRALNYVYMNDCDEALVEARKAEEFLTELNEANAGQRVYRDDAFARFLDGMLYEEADQMDDARISYEAANAAYAHYATDYGMRPPPVLPVPGELGEIASKQVGEVVFLHYNGVAPRKVSKSIQVAWDKAVVAINESQGDNNEHDARVSNALQAGVRGNAITVAFPALVQDQFSIVRSEVSVAGVSESTVVMEDIAAIAKKDLKDRMATIQARTIARAAIKFILAKVAGKAAEAKGGKVIGSLASRGAEAAAAATESADTRSWTTLPAQIRVARLRVPAGIHKVTVEFKDRDGQVLAVRVFRRVMVRPGQRTFLHHRTAL